MTEINGSFISREILPSKFDTLMCNIWWLCRRIARKQTANISAYPCTLSTLIRMQTIKRRPFRHKKTKIHPTLSNCPFGPCTMMTNMMLRCIGSFTLLKLEDVEWFSASNWKKLAGEYPQPDTTLLIVLVPYHASKISSVMNTGMVLAGSADTHTFCQRFCIVKKGDLLNMRFFEQEFFGERVNFNTNFSETVRFLQNFSKT